MACEWGISNYLAGERLSTLIPLCVLVFSAGCTHQGDSKKAMPVAEAMVPLTLRVGSPSGRCSYIFEFENDGRAKVIANGFDFNEEINFCDTAHFFVEKNEQIAKLQALMVQLSNKSSFKGPEWKDGWHYMILYDGEARVDVLAREDSPEVEALLELIADHSPIKVDKDCF